MKNIPITQSREWQQLQNDLKKQSFFEKSADFQYLAIKNSTPVGNYLYCPYGPVADTAENFKKALKSLQNLAKKENAIFIRIEPRNSNFLKNLPKSAKKSHDLNPKETWLLDLKGTDEDLKKKLPSRLLRYHKNHEKQGIIIETSHNPDDIKYLLNLQKSLAKKKGINTFSEDYLKTELKQSFATLYLVKHGADSDKGVPSEESVGGCCRSRKRSGVERSVDRRSASPVKTGASDSVSEDGTPLASSNVIAAGLVFDDATTRYNLQGAQSEEGRKLHATGILTIKLILDAKAAGKEIFDFWGIAPEDAPKDHPWAGFTSFKKTFAGYEKDYAGTYDLVEKPLRYRLYQIMRKIRRLI